MPEDTYDDDQEQTEGMVPRSHIRELEEKARKADELADKLAALERNEAFRSAGLDPNDKRASYFVKGYEGDLTAEAIRAAAAEAGFIPTGTETTPTQQNDPAEQVFAASANAGTPPPSSWAEEIAEAERIADPQQRTDAILSVVERHGGVTTRTMQ